MVEETYSEIRKTPVFCFTKFSSDDFALVEETEDHYLYKLSVPDDDKAKFLKSFGDKAVLLPQDFPQIIKKIVDDTDDFCIVADARYDDYSKGINKQHKEDFDEGRLELVLWKDIFFKYQREVRLAFSTKPTEKPIKFNVGSIREKCDVRDSEVFLKQLVSD